jgi:RNA-directed DNA polymerase
MKVAVVLRPFCVLSMNISSTTWRTFFESRGLQKDLIDSYMHYVECMLAVNLPPIFEIYHLANLLGRTPSYMVSAIHKPEYHYRTFTIPKRHGGNREISAPYPALLECQQWINRFILQRVRIHPSAYGFRKRRSIKTNAGKHLGKPHLLKMDLADFFPSIKLNRIIAVFRHLDYPPNIAFYLARLCCLNDSLPQGAATSPSLSNIIAYRLDARLSGLAMACGLTYTRYADDFTFSGHPITIKFPDIVEKIVREEGFEVRHEKTHLCRSRGKRIVTGLSVSGNKLTVPRQYKREIRQEIHHIRAHGYLSHIKKRKIRDPFYLDTLYGRLMFWKWIEPNNPFLATAIPRVQSLMSSNRIN